MAVGTGKVEMGGKVVVTGIGSLDEDEFLLNLLNEQVSQGICLFTPLLSFFRQLLVVSCLMPGKRSYCVAHATELIHFSSRFPSVNMHVLTDNLGDHRSRHARRRGIKEALPEQDCQIQRPGQPARTRSCRPVL